MTRKSVSRRSFFGASIGASMSAGASLLGSTTREKQPGQRRTQEAAPNDYEQFFADSLHWDALGRPHDWSAVREGLHPFSPERVVVMPDDTQERGRSYRKEQTRADLIEHYWRQPDYSETTVGLTDFNEFLDLLDSEKGKACVNIARVLADYYRTPEVFLDWARGFLLRETLGSSCISGHYGFVHDYQGGVRAKAKNPPVDWWLFLIPDGMDFRSLYGKPTHLLFGTAASILNGVVCHCATCAMGRLASKCHEDVIAISRMDRLTACRYLNGHIPSVMEGRKPVRIPQVSSADKKENSVS